MKNRKKRKYTNGSTRLMEVPVKYQADFLNKMDFRTEKFHLLDKAFKEIVVDLGGGENLSRLEIGLIERFVYCEFMIRQLETEMANSGNGSQGEFLDKWIKLNHSIQSIVAKLGVQKRKTGESGLKQYLDGQEE